MIWICKRLSQEKIKPPTTLNNSLAPKLKWMHNLKTAVEFEGNCYEQDKTTFAHKKCGKSVYCLRTRYVVKRFKQGFYTR